jgi:hypothetical protein
VPVGASSDVQMRRHGFRKLAAIFVEIACSCPNAHFSTKTVAKNYSSLFFDYFLLGNSTNSTSDVRAKCHRMASGHECVSNASNPRMLE